jgi:hypothetical protein
MILTSMMGLRWASTIFPLIEQGMIVDGELIEITSEKHLTPSDQSSSMASLRIASLGGLGGEGGTVGRRPEGRFCQGISRLIGVDKTRLLPKLGIEEIRGVSMVSR